MNLDERESAEPFGLGNETIELIPCACGCGRWVDDFDPCEIDGKLFSDHCASDVIGLRFGGTIEGVSVKTKKLNDTPKTFTYICPYCDYAFLDESEAESAVDCGCPSCRHIIDWSE